MGRMPSEALVTLLTRSQTFQPVVNGPSSTTGYHDALMVTSILQVYDHERLAWECDRLDYEKYCRVGNAAEMVEDLIDSLSQLSPQSCHLLTLFMEKWSLHGAIALFTTGRTVTNAHASRTTKSRFRKGDFRAAVTVSDALAKARVFVHAHWLPAHRCVGSLRRH